MREGGMWCATYEFLCVVGMVCAVYAVCVVCAQYVVCVRPVCAIYAWFVYGVYGV